MKPFSWKTEEKQIHLYVIEAFENQGYECINFHESGASVEGGIDILSNKINEKIAVAVKIKPQQKDLTQLGKFIKNTASKHIYIYINDPTRPFYEEITRYKEEGYLEIYNSHLLHAFLVKNKSIGYLKKFLFNHPIFQNYIKILETWSSVRHTKKSKIDLSDLKLMWDWKDKVVSFHKTAKFYFDYKDQRIKDIIVEREETFKELLDETIVYLDYLNKEIAELKSVFESIKKTNPGILAEMWMICKSRSNWCEILPKIENKNDEINKIFFEWFFNFELRIPYTFISYVLERMADLGEYTEYAIDRAFEAEVLKSEVD